MIKILNFVIGIFNFNLFDLFPSFHTLHKHNEPFYSSMTN